MLITIKRDKTRTLPACCDATRITPRTFKKPRGSNPCPRASEAVYRFDCRRVRNDFFLHVGVCRMTAESVGVADEQRYNGLFRMRAPDMPWLFFVQRHFESEASHRQNKVPRPCSRRRPRQEGLHVPDRALRQARRRAGRWYCRPVSLALCLSTKVPSGEGIKAISPGKSTILTRPRQSWVMNGRPRSIRPRLVRFLSSQHT